MDLNELLSDLGWRGVERPSKFIAYFHLIEACGHPGCPVCHCLGELTLRYLDGLLYERVNDAMTRGVLDRSWGFCAWHAATANEVRNSALGIAIIYRDLLDEARARLAAAHRERSTSPIRRGWRRVFHRPGPLALVRAWASRKRCPPCEALAAAEASYLNTLLEFIEEDDLEQAYGRSAGLCLPHIVLALDCWPRHRGTEPLLRRTLGKLDRVAGHLGSFIDKHDYRKRAPLTPEEAASRSEAVAFLTGRPGLFGNDLPRIATRRAACPSRPSASEPTWPPTEPEEAMNLSGEQASTRTWEAIAHELREEVEALKARLAKYEPPSEDA